jgi:hypothetical protein
MTKDTHHSRQQQISITSHSKVENTNTIPEPGEQNQKQKRQMGYLHLLKFQVQENYQPF